MKQQLAFGRRHGLGALGAVLALAPLMVHSVLAQQTDLLGVFFDAQGTTSSFRTSTANEWVPIYLVLLAPSRTGGIESWECILEARATTPLGVYNWQLAGGGVNYDQAPRFWVILASPLPPADALVVATASVFVPDPGTELAFYLHAYDPPSLRDPPGYGYPVEMPNYGYGGGALQSLGWTSGCESEPVAVINDDGQDAPAEMGGVPDQLIFGLTSGGTVTRHFSLTNAGVVAISGVIDVTGDGFFFAHSSLPWAQVPRWFRLEPGQELAVDVVLQDGSGDERTGALTIESCGRVSTVPLLAYAMPACVVSSAELGFGEVVIGHSRTLTVSVSNQGSQPLPIEPTEHCSDFEILTPPEVIPPGASVPISIRFTPQWTTLRSCVVSLGPETCDDIVCSGIGLGYPPDCWVSQTELDFGAVPIGAARQEVLQFGSTYSVPDGTVALPPDCAAFRIMSGGGTFHGFPGWSRDVALCFLPDHAGEFSCLLDLGPDCAAVTLRGVGIVAEVACSLDADSLDFGAAIVGNSLQREFTIHNDSAWQLSGDLQANGEGFSLAAPGYFLIEPGGSHLVQARFAPPDSGAYAGAIATGLGMCPALAVTGRGTWGGYPCAASPAAIDFGTQYPGSPVQRSFSVHNGGNVVLRGDMTVSGQGFSLGSPGPFTLAPLAERSWQVTFLPTDAGPHTGLISTGLGPCPSVPVMGVGDWTHLPCSFTPAFLDFGNQYPGWPVHRELVIHNDGGAVLQGELAVTGDGFTIQNAGPFTLDPWQAVTLRVVFDPPDIGAYSGEIRTGLESCAQVALVGRGTEYASQAEIVAWGEGPGEPPSPNIDFVAAATSGSHSLGLRSDGSIVAWGDNGAGQCDVPLPNADFVAVSAYGWQSLGLKSDGTIVAWGDGPGDPPAPNAGFTAIAAGWFHSLGLKADGSIVAWGANDYGQCNVPEPNSGFVAVAAGGGGYGGVSERKGDNMPWLFLGHSLGLKADGTIVTWGVGPGDPPAPNAGFAALAAGEWHSLGLKTDGSVVAWGDISDGWCDVPEPNAGFTAIAAGWSHSLGLKADGSIVAWGNNGAGACDVPSPNMGYGAIAAGGGQSLAVRSPTVVAAFLTAFAAEAQGQAVTLTWQLSEAVDPWRLRLSAARGGLVWVVPVNATGAGFFTARDDSPHLSGGGSVRYVLELRGENGVWSVIRDEVVALTATPRVTVLSQPSPNPFNPRTVIRYSVQQAGHATLAVYDLQGRHLRTLVDAALPAGEQSVEWDGRDGRGVAAGSGTYVIRLVTEQGMQTSKVTLAK